MRSAGLVVLLVAGVQASDRADKDSKPCVAGARCQNGWHDLTKGVWDCVNTTEQTDKTFQAAIGPACSGNDLDVHYQTCTPPCCQCWKAYWPAYTALWGRCGAPASYVAGEAQNGLKAKEDWLCGNGAWGSCVAPKWDAYNFTECTSIPDKAKLREVYGLFRDRRSTDESCACIRQATLALDVMEQDCQVPGASWFVEYGKRRYKENQCGELKPYATAELAAAPPAALAALAASAGLVAAAGFLATLVPRLRARTNWAEGEASLLA